MDTGLDFPVGEWFFVGVSIQPTQSTIYLNNDTFTRQATYGPADFSGYCYIGYSTFHGPERALPALVDDFRLYDHALTAEEIADVMLGKGGVVGSAGNPSPGVDATDVWRDEVLSWTAGKYAATHDVYMGVLARSSSGKYFFCFV